VPAEWIEVLKATGPVGILAVVVYYLLKFILDHYKEDIQSRVTLAASIDGLTNSTIENRRVLEDVRRLLDQLRRGNGG